MTQLSLFLRQSFKFFAIGACVYLLIALIAPPSLVRNFYIPEWREKLFIQDSKSLDAVDVLILGSSHVSSTFDPRAFKAAGYQSLNLAAPSQSPENSYYILRDFFDGALSKQGSHPIPKVIIHELYCKTISDNGVLEPYIKTVENYPSTINYLQLGILTKNVTALNMYVSSALKNALGIYAEKRTYSDIPGYAKFGYYTNPTKRDLTKFRRYDVPIESLSFKDAADKDSYERTRNQDSYVCNGAPDKTQMSYLKKIIDLAASHSVPVVLVVAPVPSDFSSNIKGYSGIADKTAAFARENGVTLISDFSSLGLSDTESFIDSNHLNNSGAKKVSDFVIKELENQGFLNKI